jgi:transposase
LLKLLQRWKADASKAGATIDRIVVAFEAGRDGFWLACWLRAHGILDRIFPAEPLGSASATEHEEHRACLNL